MATMVEHGEALRLWTTVDYHRMGEIGILNEDDRVELIEGRIVTMSPIGGRHAACVKRLNRLLVQAVGNNAIVGIQDPIRLDDYSEPQPDAMILRHRDDFYAASHPTAEDVLLLVEVAETSEHYDREVKVPLYARAGIAEVWLVNLGARRLEVYTNPNEGRYATVRLMQGAERVVAHLLPEVEVVADALFD